MLAVSHRPEPQFTRKRSRSFSDHVEYPHEILARKRAKSGTVNTSLQNSSNQQEVTSVLQTGKTFDKERLTRKRPAESDYEDNRKRRRRQFSEEIPASVASWLDSLPASSQEFEDMSQSPSKRPRSQSENSERDFLSDNETDSTVSRSKKYSTYDDPRYQTVLESKNSFMYDSDQGPLSEELEFCKTLYTRTQPVPNDPAFEKQLLSRFLKLLQGRSELHICILLHSRLVPPAEYLSLFEPQKFDGLIDGYNECWNKAIVFYKKLPQPDHTVAYRDLVLTDQQRRKLDILPEVSSFFTGREGTCFPFFTCEVKCGKQGLDTADRANTNSMTIALRGVVELYRRAGRVMDVDRRFLGFSISHDDRLIRIFGHYPEINGEKTSYYQHSIREFICGDEDGKERWTSYTFVYNLYTQFAPKHIERIKKVIDLLPEPMSQSFHLATALNDSQETLSQQEFAKPGLPQGRVTIAQLKQQMQMLMAQLEQQRKEHMAQYEQQRKEYMAQSEQQRKELMAQLEQQRKDSEQQRKDSEQQRKELMQMLNQQSD